VTDGSGRCRFTPIFPGWYAGRLTHLHGKLKINGITNPTTNFFFPKSVETDVYNSPLYRGRGQNNTSVAQDVELRGDVARFNALTMQVTGDVGGGYGIRSMTTAHNSRAKRGTAAAVALTALTMAVAVSAHRRDESLQAARIAVGPESVRIDVELTPGIALAPATLADIDRNGDGTLSAGEQRTYANRVISALDLTVDDQRLALEPLSSTFPAPDAVYRGEGPIRLGARAPLPPQSLGAHHLRFRNAYQPAQSVYLANALVPDSARIAVLGQQRDAGQTELTIEFAVRARTEPFSLAWMVLPAAVGLAAYRARRVAVQKRNRDR
jgi:hypothetical protein